MCHPNLKWCSDDILQKLGLNPRSQVEIEAILPGGFICLNSLFEGSESQFTFYSYIPVPVFRSLIGRLF